MSDIQQIFGNEYMSKQIMSQNIISKYNSKHCTNNCRRGDTRCIHDAIYFKLRRFVAKMELNPILCSTARNNKKYVAAQLVTQHKLLASCYALRNCVELHVVKIAQCNTVLSPSHPTFTGQIGPFPYHGNVLEIIRKTGRNLISIVLIGIISILWKLFENSL